MTYYMYYPAAYFLGAFVAHATGLGIQDSFFIIGFVEVLSLLFVFLFGREIFNAKVGLLASLIMAVSDMHGEVAWLPAAIERHAPDLLLCAGDWGDPGQVSEAQYRALTRRVHVLTVYGNHDDRALLARLHNYDGTPVLLGQGEARRVGKVTVAGISGIWAKTKLGARLSRQWEAARRRRPDLSFPEWAAGRELPPYVTDAEVAALAAGLAGAGVEILVTHGCPLGVADRTPAGGRGGQRCFRHALEEVRPRVFLCGHLHRRQREDLPDGRLALNTGYGAQGEGWLIQGDAGRWEATPLEEG